MIHPASEASRWGKAWVLASPLLPLYCPVSHSVLLQSFLALVEDRGRGRVKVW